MSGPAPKPTALKILEGNPGKRALSKNEPKPRPVTPEPPEFLKREALAEWQRIVPELEAVGLLTVVDMASLAAYCQSYQRWIQAERKINREGMVIISDRGNKVAHPAIIIAQKERQLIKAFCAEFGLTPSSRGRMTVPGKDEKDDWESLLD